MSTTAKILIVEDDDDLRRGMMLRLRAFGYEVAAARDGAGAATVALEEKPDLVLLDIGLPAGDGLDVLDRYASTPALSGLPVIVLTGRDPRTTEQEGRRRHVAAFLRKPVENDVLATTTELALRGETIPTGHLGGRR
jgi:DNA-binding response OmpR family regulator